MDSSSLRRSSILALALSVGGCGSGGKQNPVDGGAGAEGKAGAGGKAETGSAGTGGSQTGTAGTAGGSAGTSGAHDAGGLDLGGVPPPSMLTATVRDRRATTFELVWTAPSDNGASVAGYQIRYAKVPITTANFDDTTVTKSVPYVGTPHTPGETDGAIVTAYIENGYYFAVIGTNSSGASVGALMSTSTAVTAHFNITTLNGTSSLSDAQFGIQFDGSGDVNGDKQSDILVGSADGQAAYLFFGMVGSFGASTPAVVFSGDTTTTSFGRGVAEIGDIDGDGREDLAIADPLGSPPRVFIYKGRATWPITLTVANADYVLTPDTSYNTSAFGISMARLGDFDGDGIDDFAIGAQQFKTGGVSVGRVVVVLGKTGFGSLTLPSTTEAITIDGDTTLSLPQFGTRVLGLGHFYSVTTGTTLVVAAPGLSSSTNASQGHLYTFHGQSGSGGAISLSSADSTFAGPGAGADIGSVLANLGPMVSALPSIGSGNPADTFTTAGSSGSTFVLSGGTTSGPFATRTLLVEAGTAKGGQVVLGGGVSGENVSYSLLGDSKPDLVLVPQSGGNILIVDGETIAALSTAGATEAATIAAVSLPTLSGWGSTGLGEGQLVPDINGDGYADFALGNAINSVAGSVAVYW